MRSVFISSTFKDMEEERDLLHEKVFPRLRKLIAGYGEDVQELDLRWGVDTIHLSEEESGKVVLQVCIDAIDRCVPFIIVLLGERYGWIPKEEIISATNDTRVNECYESGMSITNLEIKYGAFREEAVLKHCVFCFRNADVMESIEPEYRHLYVSESEDHFEKLSKLKEIIRHKKDVNLLEYHATWDSQQHHMSGLDQFAKDLYCILEKMVKEEFKDFHVLNWQEKHLLEVSRTKEYFLSSYVQRAVDEASIMESIVS